MNRKVKRPPRNCHEGLLQLLLLLLLLLFSFFCDFLIKNEIDLENSFFQSKWIVLIEMKCLYIHIIIIIIILLLLLLLLLLLYSSDGQKIKL